MGADEDSWDAVICDEAHYLKSPDAQRTQAAFGETRWSEEDEQDKRMMKETLVTLTEKQDLFLKRKANKRNKAAVTAIKTDRLWLLTGRRS